MQQRCDTRRLRRLAGLAVLAQLLALHSVAHAADPTLGRELDSLVADAARLGATTGIEVVSIPTGEVLFARNANAPLVPASNMKLISGAVALEELGTGAVFATALSTAAPVESDGTMAGPLVLAGTGDPTLHTEGLVEMAGQLRELGVLRIAGDLIVDSNCIADRGMGEGWLATDENRSFAAQISGLCANWNCVEITVIPGYRAGAPAHVEIEPVTSYVQIEVQATTAPPRQGTRLIVYRDTGRNAFVVKGTIAVGHEPVTVRRTVHEPDLYAGT
ncbi:MAG: D-alanyl-D-alanine carboxypeptidase/D-alanyl-D-alanine-endopeptidase, partial [Armatimonadota bacterium]